MKDYLNMLGGMTGGILLLIVYIFCWGLFTSAYGADEYPNPQPVPIGKYQVADSAYMQIDVPLNQYIPKNGDVAVVNDFLYVLVTLDEWERLTNVIKRLETIADRRIQSDLLTETGRKLWHGKLKEKRVTPNGVEWEYEDGFIYTEAAKAGRRVSPAVERVKKSIEQKESSPDIPKRLADSRKAAALAKPKKVNITYGMGGKIIKTEDAK